MTDNDWRIDLIVPDYHGYSISLKPEFVGWSSMPGYGPPQISHSFGWYQIKLLIIPTISMCKHLPTVVMWLRIRSPNTRFTSKRIHEDLLDGKFFDGAVDDLTNLILESVQFHRKDVLQRECLSVHVKRLTSLLHQLLPVTGQHTDFLLLLIHYYSRWSEMRD